MEKSFDMFFDKIFNNPQTLWANILFSIFILLLGLFFIKKDSSQGKKLAGLFCLLIGSFTIISNVIKLFFPLLGS